MGMVSHLFGHAISTLAIRMESEFDLHQEIIGTCSSLQHRTSIAASKKTPGPWSTTNPLSYLSQP